MANPGGFLRKVIADKPLGPEKAIFAVREVVQRDIPIYQSRGMACAVEVGGRKRLLTWHGVINENDQAKLIKLHRSSHELEMSKIKENGGCSFISVEGGDDAFSAKCSILYLQVPESKEKMKDVVAHSFIGNKDIVKFTFKYSQQSRKHELHSSDKKGCIFEKSAILGSPIITDKDRVIGVVGEDSNGQFCPNFLTETESNHQEKNAMEDGTCEVEVKDKGSPLDTPDASGNKENDPSEGGTCEIKLNKYEESGCVPATPDAFGPIGLATNNLEKLTKNYASIESKVKTPVPVSDQFAEENQERELRDEQNKFVSGHKNSSSSFETVPALESTEKNRRSGKVPPEWFPYLALDTEGNVPWKDFGKSLNLSDAEIQSIDKDNNEEYEKYYKMLKTWWQRGDASYDNLAFALRKHDLQLIHDDYCLMEQYPPVKKVMELPRNLKEGPIDDKALQAISHAVKGKRKRLGRALGLRDDRLDDIEEENPRDAPEQSYQILKAWRNKNGKNASYSALAQAFYDRTVNLSRVVMDLCLK